MLHSLPAWQPQSTWACALDASLSEPPAAILDSLPLIANNLRMVHSISRHYSQPAALAGFLRKLANQLIKRCRQHVLAAGKLWEQADRGALVAALGDACRLHDVFVEHAVALLAKPDAAAGSAHPAAADALAKYGLFAKRCCKLAEMFGTVHQFAQLAQHMHIEGIGSVLAAFGEVPALQGCAVLAVGRACAARQLSR